MAGSRPPADCRRRCPRRIAGHERGPNSAAASESAPSPCAHCGKTPALCICDSVVPLDNKIALLILQHPQEQDRGLGTAGLTARHFTDATLKIGLSWPSLGQDLGRPLIRSAGPSSISVR